MTKTKDKLRSPEEIHASIRNRIKNMYAEKGETLTDDEAYMAAQNLIGFFQKVVEIKSRDK